MARLHDIDNDVVSKSLKALGAGLGDFAAVNIFVADLRVAAASKRDPYAAHKSKKEEKFLFPYKGAEERALLRVAKIAADYATARSSGDTFAALRRSFEAQAKSALFSPQEVMLAQYLLYGDDPTYSCFFLASLLVHVPNQQRIAVHNWSLAQSMDEPTRNTYGEAIARLALPLFPPSATGAEALNTKLLSEELGVAGGGGRADSSLFSKGKPLFTGGRPAGGGVLPVIGSSGTEVGIVDVAPIETAYAAQQHTIDMLRHEVQTLKSGQGQKQRQRQQQQQQPLQQYAPSQHQQAPQQQQQQQQYYPARGRGRARDAVDQTPLTTQYSNAPPPPYTTPYSGRGGYGSRGRGRGASGGSGDNVQDDPGLGF